MQETITLGQAKKLIKSLSSTQSLLLLSPPGIGKSDIVNQIANENNLEVRSLLGTQIAPEDVSGIPKIIGERSVFCPPRVLLPENAKPFCLFLDELPATSPDVQKAFYSLLLERRIGEYKLPEGTWVVSAGNRMEDRALVRSMSSALINRVTILNIRIDYIEWLIWAKKNNIRDEILSFISFMPDALMRNVPSAPIPFSTPRAWASLSQSIDLAEKDGILDKSILRALAFGKVSPEDAIVFCSIVEEKISSLKNIIEYIKNPSMLPKDNTSLWFILNFIRNEVKNNKIINISSEDINKFINALPMEQRCALIINIVDKWVRLGAKDSLITSLREIIGSN
jgi:hypothetical protein